MNNSREVADDFFEAYLKILDISDEAKIYRFEPDGSGFSKSGPFTLSDYLAAEANEANMTSIVLGSGERK